MTFANRSLTQLTFVRKKSKKKLGSNSTSQFILKKKKEKDILHIDIIHLIYMKNKYYYPKEKRKEKENTICINSVVPQKIISLLKLERSRVQIN